ncbi:hypothetical protein [Micromonospora sp. NPDC050200]|uniref:hypothetical protein n=1 Tax=Micromonospora sp. NPDC050200 TaxID=3155664 RepID=UPI0033DC2891
MSSSVPSDRADALDWLAFAQSGVLRTAQATRLLTEGVVRGMVRSGRWRSICRGVLLAGNGRLTRDQQLWVAVLAVGPDAVLAGTTAATEAGVRGLRTDPLHVLVPAARRAARTVLRRMPIDMAPVIVHRTSVLPGAHLQLARPTRTTTARALVDAAGWTRDVDEAQSTLAAGCQQRRVTPEEIRAVVDALPRAPRRQLIRQTVTDIAGGAAGSTLSGCAAGTAFPGPSCNIVVPMPPDGSAGWTRTGGSGGCTSRSTGRITWTSATGRRTWRGRTPSGRPARRILCFPAWLVRARPDEVAATLHRALAAAGWRPQK